MFEWVSFCANHRVVCVFGGGGVWGVDDNTAIIALQEYSGDDPADLFMEEREAQLRKAADEKRQQQLLVPGIVNPHDRPDEMQE